MEWYFMLADFLWPLSRKPTQSQMVLKMYFWWPNRFLFRLLSGQFMFLELGAQYSTSLLDPLVFFQMDFGFFTNPSGLLFGPHVDRRAQDWLVFRSTRCSKFIATRKWARPMSCRKRPSKPWPRCHQNDSRFASRVLVLRQFGRLASPSINWDLVYNWDRGRPAKHWNSANTWRGSPPKNIEQRTEMWIWTCRKGLPSKWSTVHCWSHFESPCDDYPHTHLVWATPLVLVMPFALDVHPIKRMPPLAQEVRKVAGTSPLWKPCRPTQRHCDRACELRSHEIRKWTLDRGIITTLTTGSSYKSNGRVENEVGSIKRAIRTLVSAKICTLEQWPLAARHIAERRLRLQLHQQLLRRNSPHLALQATFFTELFRSLLCSL